MHWICLILKLIKYTQNKKKTILLNNGFALFLRQFLKPEILYDIILKNMKI